MKMQNSQLLLYHVCLDDNGLNFETCKPGSQKEEDEGGGDGETVNPKPSIFIIAGSRQWQRYQSSSYQIAFSFYSNQRKKSICAFHYYFPLWQKAWHTNLFSNGKVSLLEVSTLRPPSPVHLQSMRIRSCGVIDSSASMGTQYHSEHSHKPQQLRLEHYPCLPQRLKKRTGCM